MHRISRPVLVAALAIVATVVAGCAASPAPADDGRLRLVASTNVYGDIASTVGGDAVDVTSIISDPDKDPHEYEADARTQLALSKADIVIENGGGYDDFVDTMLSAARTHPTLLNAVKISGRDAGAADFNEHVWYDYPTVVSLVSRLVDALTKADPADRSGFESRGGALIDRIKGLESLEQSLGASYQGEGVAITEPVPLYVLDAIGLVDRTPAKFSEAIEDGTDAAPDVLAQALAVIRDKKVALIAYNVQTGGPQTDAVLAAAKRAGVPAVPVSETLPEGMGYVDWQAGVLALIHDALGD